MNVWVVVRVVALLLAGCVKDLGVENAQNPEDLDPMFISVEEALSEMYDLMEGLYGPDTRASKRTVASVNTYKTPLYLTRGTGEEATELAYIVNFAEGGFSVLSARRGTPSVWCVTEAGEFTPEEVDRLTLELAMEAAGQQPATRALPGTYFDPAKVADDGHMSYIDIHNLGYEYGNPGSFVLSDYNVDWLPGQIQTADTGDYLVGSTDDSFIKRELLIAAMGSGLDDPNDGIDDGDSDEAVRTVYGPWSNGTPVGPLLESKLWHQGSPFNDNCPGSAYAGCVPLALTQILAYNETPAITSICPNVTSTWDDLKNWDSNSNAQVDQDMSLIVHAVGQGVNAWYNVWFSDGSTHATAAAAKRYMKRNGYSNVKKHSSYSADIIYDMIVIEHKPVFIAARKTILDGHAWVIDGHMYQNRSATSYDKDNDIVYTGTDSRSLVHCDFGWSGGDNGYYVTQLFDTGDGPVIPDTGAGSGGSSNYTWGYRIIEY